MMYFVVYQTNATTTPQLMNNTLLCRTCLNESGMHIDIFNHRRNNTLVADMLVTLTSLEIRKEDGFPTYICNNCMEKLTPAFDFKTMVIESNTKLHQLRQCEEIKKEGELCNNDMEYIPRNETNIKTEQTIITNLSYKNHINKEEMDVKTSLELESVEKHDGFLDDSTGSSSHPGGTEKYEKLLQTTSIAELHCEYKDSIRNQARDVTAGLDYESLDKDGGAFDDSSRASFSLEDPLKIETCGKVEQTAPGTNSDSRNEDSNVMEVEQELQLLDENGDVYDDFTETSLSPEDPLRPENYAKIQTTLAAKEKKNRGYGDERHAELLDNPDYKRIISSGLTKEQKKRETIFCTECNKTFSYHYYIKVHAYIHTGKVPYKCDKCEKRYPKESLLKTHMRAHFQTRDFACDVCGKAFFQKHHLKNHKIEKHSEERPYKCNICDRTFKRSVHLAQHSSCHVKDKNILCEICGKAFVQLARLHDHKKNTHSIERNFVCTVCDKGFAHNWHFQIHLGESPCKDTLGNRAMDVAGRLKFVSVDDGGVVPGDFGGTSSMAGRREKCEKFDGTTPAAKRKRKQGDKEKLDNTHRDSMEGILNDSPSTTIKHEDMLEEDWDYQINQPITIEHEPSDSITAKFQGNSDESSGYKNQISTTNNLVEPDTFLHQIDTADKVKLTLLDNPDCKRIMESNLTSDEKRRGKVVCTLCNHSYNFGYYVAKHIYAHDESLPFKCEQCNIYFPKESSLKRHTQLHAEKQEYKCDECGVRFMFIYKLRQHQLIHTTKKRHECNQCKKLFKSEGGLKTHQLTHNGFLCDICGKKCVSEQVFKRHSSTHAAAKP